MDVALPPQTITVQVKFFRSGWLVTADNRLFQGGDIVSVDTARKTAQVRSRPRTPGVRRRGVVNDDERAIEAQMLGRARQDEYVAMTLELAIRKVANVYTDLRGRHTDLSGAMPYVMERFAQTAARMLEEERAMHEDER